MEELSIDSVANEKFAPIACSLSSSQPINQIAIDIENNNRDNRLKVSDKRNNNNKNRNYITDDSPNGFETTENISQETGHISIRQIVKSNDNEDNQENKLHFTIDWRNLTYFKINDKSFFSGAKNFGSQRSLLAANTTSGKSSPNSATNSEGCDCSNSIDFNYDSSQYYRGKKRILNNLDGRFKSGQLNAILGPSGAGKTTFLSALFGDKQESAYGQTKVTWYSDSKHEQPIIKAQPKRPIKIAFLPQHDHLLHHLTVYETLMFASKIKNANKRFELAEQQDKTKCHDELIRKKKGTKFANYHRQNVKRVAKMLKLTDCFNTKCGQLSGGQYKRVSIGQELLSEPDVIILDEPTSGLDAMTCLLTIKTLKSIVTKRPMSIILTIHQPDIDVFNLFDRIYVIAQGGLAIYEGPPQQVVSTLASAGLEMPSVTYNPARFIVENAFLIGTESAGHDGCLWEDIALNGPSHDEDDHEDEEDSGLLSSDEDESSVDQSAKEPRSSLTSEFLRRSMVSLTGALGVGGGGSKTIVCALGALGDGGKIRDSGRRPLLNLGVETSDGQLITRKQLDQQGDGPNNRGEPNGVEIKQLERVNLLKRLNEIQRGKYQLMATGTMIMNQDSSELGMSTSSSSSSSSTADYSTRTDGSNRDNGDANNQHHAEEDLNSIKSDYSSACENHLDQADGQLDTSKFVSTLSLDPNRNHRLDLVKMSSSSSRIELKNSSLRIGDNDFTKPDSCSLSLKAINDGQASCESVCQASPASSASSSAYGDQAKMINDFQSKQLTSLDNNKKQNLSQSTEEQAEQCYSSSVTTPALLTTCRSTTLQTDTSFTNQSRTIDGQQGNKFKLKRQFDKRLSAKHNNSKQHDDPIWYHTYLLTHRTWISISRDPVFFGIQFCMHTTIPILLALIFGSSQEEGCPRVGQFDLIEFAYSDSEDFIQTTIRSIRQSIGNIGVVFFEMFVLSFAINCITALVFPLDMYVLLKEYRNGWYSLRSYFFGRTLADLPVPVVLHSMAMTILYLMTGQPLSWLRFGTIIGIVILASLVAQSVGLTIGALLMRSSQSAVLAAAGIVAPFFALSGFIVRIHTLPWIAQFFANGSYLYHLLNGFIILRYGFNRCPCVEDDFEPNLEHQVPKNLRTMASIWVGTYSDEFAAANLAVQRQSQAANKSQNIDPNIDLVEKLMQAFKTSNSYGHRIESCADVLPYAMLDFNLHDQDIYWCIASLVIMLIISRFITFSAIYYKIRSFS